MLSIKSIIKYTTFIMKGDFLKKNQNNPYCIILKFLKMMLSLLKKKNGCILIDMILILIIKVFFFLNVCFEISFGKKMRKLINLLPVIIKRLFYLRILSHTT